MGSKGKGSRLWLAVAFALALMLATAVSSHAQAPVLAVYGDADQTGTIHLVVYGPPGAQVAIFEDVGGTLRPVRSVDLNPVGAVWDVASWRCDRRDRRFIAALPLVDGSVATAVYEARTPSCRERMALQLPGAVKRGASAPATILDRWSIGGVTPELCVAPPGAPFDCRFIRLREGQGRAALPVRFDRNGRWRVELRLAGFAWRKEVQVGGGRSFVLKGGPTLPRVLLTGDSMMLNINSVLTDRLRPRVEAPTDTHVGTGISKPGFDWIAQARRQMRRQEPDATVVFLGANDAFEMTTPAGARVPCCGAPWIAEYARRARRMMQIYRRDGVASSVWLTVPAPRSPNLGPGIAGVNEAIRQAAVGVPGVRVLDLEKLYTPDFRYRANMPYRGRVVRVRADDGLHLSLPGGVIAAAQVGQALRGLGLL
jgi:lysophospholipase L1-like esterase